MKIKQKRMKDLMDFSYPYTKDIRQETEEEKSWRAYRNIPRKCSPYSGGKIIRRSYAR